MAIYQNDRIDQLVKIDTNHAELVRALIMCHKSRRVLEFGFGAGEATRAILAGLHYNQQSFEYKLVDNWMDFGGRPPDATQRPEYKGIQFITSSEYDFVGNCKEVFDFILSDADHYNTEKWFDFVYERLLSPNGILIYHDVMNVVQFPNLLRIYESVIRQGHHCLLLNRSSLPTERCERGLLVIFKNAPVSLPGVTREPGVA